MMNYIKNSCLISILLCLNIAAFGQAHLEKKGTIQFCNSRKKISLTNVVKTCYDDTSKYKSACENWILSKQEILSLIAKAKPISTHDFMYLYYVLPCEIKGYVFIDNKKYDFTINAGSFLKISNTDSTFYYSCSDRESEKYFIELGGNPRRDLGD